MLDIDKAFNPETKSVHEHFQSPGVGFYIPLYQREYSWDRDNIEQLLDDLSRGVESLIENPKDEIRFLGTIIAVKVVDKRSIYPRDPQGLPSSIENIIDGQQRLSTIALFTTLLYKHLRYFQNRIQSNTEEDRKFAEQLYEACNYWKTKLLDVFSLDLQRGTPHRKPKIIRGNRDQWTKDGDIQDNYKSEVAHYLAHFIDYVDKHSTPPKPNRNFRAGKNLVIIDRWLNRTVIPAHIDQSAEFTPAWEILSKVNQDNIWQYERPELTDVIVRKQIGDKNSISYISCCLVQLFSVCHYLLDRCCFTIIQPMNEDWAFDMFQSLNATGTPLTAIETFKPTVVNVTDDQPNIKYKDSDAEKSFEKVDQLFIDSKSASQKSKLANEFLTSFAIVTTGSKLQSHFSKQRKWLDDTYMNTKKDGCKNYQEQRDFIHFFGNYAYFYKNVWSDYRGGNGILIPGIGDSDENELASLLLLYLKESNHKMAITILGSFYSSVIDGKENSISNFIKACKLIAAFYTIWRSASSNSGLDNVYRNFFRGEDGSISSNTWISKRTITFESLRNYLCGILEDKGIATKEDWIRKAQSYLAYNKAKSVCKFTLYITAHETVTDDDHPGLMKIGKPGTLPYLTLRQWSSDDLRSIEHIAPKEGGNVWDENLYLDDELYQSIGNLTLLPLNVNISASNKGWPEKYLYYQHLSEGDPQKQQELANKANSKEIFLSKGTIELLKNANYNGHIKSIVTLDEKGDWDAEFVKKRTERMLDITWERILSWILT